MDLKNIKKIIEMFEESKVSDLELESDDLKIKLSKKSGNIIREVSLDNNETSIAEDVKKENKVNEKYAVIKSPIVGTFYSANSPSATPFVREGQHIKAGDILCIVEAMKILNEIKSEINGTVKKILVHDGDLIQFDQELIYVEED